MSIARSLSAILLFAGLPACGGDSTAEPDAGAGADAAPDSAPPADAPVACGARSTSDDPAMAALLDWMEDRMGSDAIPGAAIAVVRDGEIAETGLLGVKNDNGCDPITEDTRFRFTPVTQLYTTAAILDAASDGVIALDAPITQYVPSLTVAGGDLAGVTVQGLVTHTSGWARYGLIECPADVSLASWFADHSDERTLWAPGGAMYINTATGPSLAGLALEQAEQTVFSQVVRGRILTPLGSTATYAYDDVVAGDHATGHDLSGTEMTQRICPILEPTGSLYGSIHDLALMARMILRGGDGVLAADAVASMLADQAPHFVPGWANTYGFWRIPYGDVTTYWVTGFGYGFTAEVVLVPERSFGFVLLANRHLNAFSRGGSHFRPSDAGLEALELLLDLPAYQWGTNTTAPATWSDYAGTYVDPVGVGNGPRTFTVSFDAESSALAIDMGGIPVTLAPSYASVEHGPDVFTGSYLGQYVTLRFWRDGNDLPWAISGAFGEMGPPAFRQ